MLRFINRCNREQWMVSTTPRACGKTGLISNVISIYEAFRKCFSCCRLPLPSPPHRFILVVCFLHYSVIIISQQKGPVKCFLQTCGGLRSGTPRTVRTEPRRCVKVEVAVLGSPSLTSLVVSVDVKQHRNETVRTCSCIPGRSTVAYGPGYSYSWLSLSLPLTRSVPLCFIYRSSGNEEGLHFTLQCRYYFTARCPVSMLMRLCLLTIIKGGKLWTSVGDLELERMFCCFCCFVLLLFVVVVVVVVVVVCVWWNARIRRPL